jgi:DNA repair exonuclease SbcCD nuclease subunit
MDRRYKKDLLTVAKGLVDTVEQVKPDYVFIAGDAFHSKLPTPTELGFLSAILRRILDKGVTVVMIPGNHDTPFHSQIDHTLKPFENLQLPGLHILSTAGTYPIKDINVLAIPYIYFNKQEELAKLKITHDSFTGQNLFSLVHAWVDGYLSLPTDEREFCITRDYLMSLNKVSYHALGHIHNCGAVLPNAYYCGSPFRVTWGETEPQKFFLLWDNGQVFTIPTQSLPLVNVDVNIKQDISTIKNCMCKIVARNIQPEQIVDAHELDRKLKDQGNFTYLDLELPTIQLSTTSDATEHSFDSFLDEYVKKNDLKVFKQTYIDLCSKIVQGDITNKSSPFLIDELYPKGGTVNNEA